jgi:hypothetical protein
MKSCNWFKAFRQIVLTLALALTVTSTVIAPPPPDLPDHPTHPATPQVNWGS